MSAQPAFDLLLQTKIRLPRLKPQLVERPRLVQRLDDAAWCRLTLVSAPAGFGKTTLLTAWARVSSRPFAWLTLDEGDNSTERFLRYLVAAIQKTFPTIGTAAQAMLDAPLPLQPAQLMASLINDLEQAGQPMALVLDDIHLLVSREIFDLIDELLDNQPEPLHLVLAGRSDPPIALARLRARGELNEIRGTDLRFSTEEAAAFLNHLMGLSLTPQQVAALETRTEGWVAGLQLAALSMRDRTDSDRFIRVFTGSHRYILDYLVDEVLRRQPAEVQEFLLKTSILERMCASLCTAVVSGQMAADSQDHRDYLLSTDDHLLFLERSNLFLTPLDDGRLWFRYHTLFADLLRYRLAEVYPQEIPSLHRRAADWLAEKGMAYEAVGHYAAAGDTRQAGELVQSTGFDLLITGQVNRFLGWLSSLPPGVMASNPRLHLMYAWGLTSQNLFRQTIPHLDAAEKAIQSILKEAIDDETTAGWKIALAEVTGTRALVASVLNEQERTIELSYAALAGLPDGHHLRASLLMGLGVACWMTGRVQESGQALAEAARLAIDSHQSTVAVTVLCVQGDQSIEKGQLSQAVQRFQDAIRLMEQENLAAIPNIGMAFSGLAETAYQVNDLPRACELIVKALERDAAWGNQDIHVSNLTRQVRFELAAGNQAGALAALVEARSTAAKISLTPPVAIVLIEAERLALDARLSTDLSNWETAAEVIRSLAGRLPYLQKIYRLAEGYQFMTRASVEGNPGHYQEAIGLLEPLAAEMGEIGLFTRQIEIYTLLAAAYAALGQTDQARERLSAALDLAAQEGFIRLFIERGEPIHRLLEDFAREGAPHANFIRRLIAAYPESQPGLVPASPPQDRSVPAASVPDGLSAREVEVLRLVELGLSNSEIAARLTLSPGTVKRHIHNIFEKLGASSRAEVIHISKGKGYL